MTKDETLQRLCSLVTKVGRELFEHHEASDCFCGQTQPFGFLAGDFRMSDKVIAFIEDAVTKALVKR